MVGWARRFGEPFAASRKELLMNGPGSIDYWTNIFTPEGLRKMYIENPELNRLVGWWNRDERLRGYSPAQFVSLMDDLEISKTFVPSFKMQSFKNKCPLLSIDVKEVRYLMENTDGRVGGLYGIDVGRGMDAVRELEMACKE